MYVMQVQWAGMPGLLLCLIVHLGVYQTKRIIFQISESALSWSLSSCIIIITWVFCDIFGFPFCSRTIIARAWTWALRERVLESPWCKLLLCRCSVTVDYGRNKSDHVAHFYLRLDALMLLRKELRETGTRTRRLGRGYRLGDSHDIVQMHLEGYM